MAPPIRTYASKVIILTGASSGIGRALALALADQHPRLVLAARDEERLLEVERACRSAGAETLVVPTDVGSHEQSQRLVSRTLAQFGAIDVLVANAGIGMITNFEDVQDPLIFERIMRVNYLGAVYPTYYALSALKKSQGQIVVVSSLAGLTGVPTRTGYAASKHALFGFYDSLRIELRESGVSVTVVAPDFVVSEIHERATGSDGKPLGQLLPGHAKFMTAEDCASRIVKAMEHKKRSLVMSFRGRAGRFVRLVAPGLIDSVALRAVKRGR
jgi:short-subunit dehydrogenase